MLILRIMFIGDKIVSGSFQVFYCDIKKVEMTTPKTLAKDVLSYGDKRDGNSRIIITEVEMFTKGKYCPAYTKGGRSNMSIIHALERRGAYH